MIHFLYVISDIELVYSNIDSIQALGIGIKLATHCEIMVIFYT